MASTAPAAGAGTGAQSDGGAGVRTGDDSSDSVLFGPDPNEDKLRADPVNALALRVLLALPQPHTVRVQLLSRAVAIDRWLQARTARDAHATDPVAAAALTAKLLHDSPHRHVAVPARDECEHPAVQFSGFCDFVDEDRNFDLRTAEHADHQQQQKLKLKTEERDDDGAGGADGGDGSGSVVCGPDSTARRALQRCVQAMLVHRALPGVHAHATTITEPVSLQLNAVYWMTSDVKSYGGAYDSVLTRALRCSGRMELGIAHALLDLHSAYGLDANVRHADGGARSAFAMAVDRGDAVELSARLARVSSDDALNDSDRHVASRPPVLHRVLERVHSPDGRPTDWWLALLALCCSREVARDDGSGLRLFDRSFRAAGALETPLQFVQRVLSPHHGPQQLPDPMTRARALLVAAIGRVRAYARDFKAAVRAALVLDAAASASLGVVAEQQQQQQQQLPAVSMPAPLLVIICDYVLHPLPPPDASEALGVPELGPEMAAAAAGSGAAASAVVAAAAAAADDAAIKHHPNAPPFGPDPELHALFADAVFRAALSTSALQVLVPLHTHAVMTRALAIDRWLQALPPPSANAYDAQAVSAALRCPQRWVDVPARRDGMPTVQFGVWIDGRARARGGARPSDIGTDRIGTDRTGPPPLSPDVLQLLLKCALTVRAVPPHPPDALMCSDLNDRQIAACGGSTLRLATACVPPHDADASDSGFQLPLVRACVRADAPVIQALLDLHPAYGLDVSAVAPDSGSAFYALATAAAATAVTVGDTDDAAAAAVAAEEQQLDALLLRVAGASSDAALNVSGGRSGPVLHALLSALHAAPGDGQEPAVAARVLHVMALCCSRVSARDDGSGLNLFAKSRAADIRLPGWRHTDGDALTALDAARELNRRYRAVGGDFRFQRAAARLSAAVQRVQSYAESFPAELRRCLGSSDGGGGGGSGGGSGAGADGAVAVAAASDACVAAAPVPQVLLDIIVRYSLHPLQK